MRPFKRYGRSPDRRELLCPFRLKGEDDPDKSPTLGAPSDRSQNYWGWMMPVSAAEDMLPTSLQTGG